MRKTKRLVLVGLLLACGGKGTFSGTVSSDKLTVNDAVVVKTTTGTSGAYFVDILMTDATDICTRLKTNEAPKNATFLFLELANLDANSSPTASVSAGTYTVLNIGNLGTGTQPTGNVGTALFSKTDATCSNTGAGGTATLGTSGKVTLNTLSLNSGGSAAGSFDLTFQTNDHATGSFNASFCDVPTNVPDGGCR